MSSSYERHEAACDYCRNKKIRCDKRKPYCSICVDLGIECCYGSRLKRGPKANVNGIEKSKKKANQILHQLQNIQKSNEAFQEVLFELEFNRKLVELWKKLHERVTIEQILPVKPTFSPHTEAFIRSPQALKIIIEEFDFDVKHHFKVSNSFAGNADLMNKIWTAILEVHLSDLLAIFSSFKTSMLLSILEYLGVFLIPLKLYNYDDIASNISILIRHITDTVIFGRDNTEDKMTADQLHQLVSVLWLASAYFKMCKNPLGYDANFNLTMELYDQYKRMTSLNNQVLATEAAMYCCSVVTCRTNEEFDVLVRRINEYDKLGIMTPDLQFRFYMHLSLLKLIQEDYSDAETSLQKAEQFVQWDLNLMPAKKRALLENLFKTKLYMIRTEIYFHSGDITRAFEQVSKLRDSFLRLTPSFQRMIAAHCHLFMWGNRRLFSVDYIKLLMNTPSLNMDSIFAALEENARLYRYDMTSEQSSSVEIGSSHESSLLDQDFSCADELLDESIFHHATPVDYSLS